MERRHVSGEIELRIDGGADTPADKGLVGYAAIYGSLSEPLGGFRERLAPGAFANVLGRSPDVRCVFNHSDNAVLGRTRSGTLNLLNTSKGLRFQVPELPDTTYARDLREMLRRGDVSGCSFAFTVPQGGDAWAEEVIDNQRVLVRTIHEVGELYDVGPVAFPAYTATEVNLRDARESLRRFQRRNGYPLDLALLALMDRG